MENTQTKTEPRWERRKESRPAELMEAALDLFAEKGYAATRLEDVAQRAGVSKGTLYLYFDSKEELFKAVVRQGLVPALVEAEKLVAEFDGPAADLFRQIVLGWWQLIGDTRLSAIPKIMISEARNFPEIADFYYEEVIERGTGLFVRALERGVATGEFRDLDVRYATRVLSSPLVMLAVWKHSLGCCEREQADPQVFLATYLDIALRGLTSPEGRK
ncbi:MAG: TetR/AcrR family transcriptional regulator [Burkholderiales bacterium]|jgi:AcrR family transcriptional regulator|nr:TetR/AcrR family transcriptional regulator [Burkholderiales bacterium]